MVPFLAPAFGGHLHRVEQAGNGPGPQMLLVVHPFYGFDDLEFAFVGGEAVPNNALPEGELFPMHSVSTAAFGKAELSEPGFYGRRATSQKVGDTLRRKPFHDVFFVEKTLVKIPWRFGNFNGINEITGWRRKVAFSWRGPTKFFSNCYAQS